jgi:hypothetical protein
MSKKESCGLISVFDAVKSDEVGLPESQTESVNYCANHVHGRMQIEIADAVRQGGGSAGSNGTDSCGT